MLEGLSRFHISDGAWDMIPDLSSDVRKRYTENVGRARKVINFTASER